MTLLVIDFTFLEGRDGEHMVTELAVVDSHTNSVSSYVFKTPTARKKYQHLTQE